MGHESIRKRGDISDGGLFPISDKIFRVGEKLRRIPRSLASVTEGIMMPLT